jgi:hypothetical protein
LLGSVDIIMDTTDKDNLIMRLQKQLERQQAETNELNRKYRELAEEVRFVKQIVKVNNKKNKDTDGFCVAEVKCDYYSTRPQKVFQRIGRRISKQYDDK